LVMGLTYNIHANKVFDHIDKKKCLMLGC
jgi:hypothetical protein